MSKEDLTAATAQKTDTSPLVDVSAAVNRLRDDVDDLQHVAAEKKKPWYKTMSNLTSLAALVFAVTTGSYSLWANATHDAQAKHDSLIKILQDIMSLRLESSNSKLNAMAPEQRAEAGPLLNTKRVVLLAAARPLVRDIRSRVTSAEYSVLANESSSDSDFKQAETYYLLAYEVGEPGLGRAVALRSLGMFYMSRNPLRNVENARKYFELSANEVRGGSDPYSQYNLAFTLHMWGLGELSNGATERAQPLIAQARSTYKSISEGFLPAQWGLIDLERSLTYYPAGIRRLVEEGSEK
jgi:hypothetical protein